MEYVICYPLAKVVKKKPFDIYKDTKDPFDPKDI